MARDTLRVCFGHRPVSLKLIFLILNQLKTVIIFPFDALLQPSAVRAHSLSDELNSSAYKEQNCRIIAAEEYFNIYSLMQ